MSLSPAEEVSGLQQSARVHDQSSQITSTDNVGRVEARHSDRDYEKYGEGDEEGWQEEGKLVWEGKGRERCWKCCLASKKQCRVYQSGRPGEKLKCAWCRRQGKKSKDCDCTYLTQQRAIIEATTMSQAPMVVKRDRKAPKRGVEINAGFSDSARKRRRGRIAEGREMGPLMAHLDSIKRDLDLIKHIDEAGLDEYISNIKTRIDFVTELI